MGRESNCERMNTFQINHWTRCFRIFWLGTAFAFLFAISLNAGVWVYQFPIDPLYNEEDAIRAVEFDRFTDRIWVGGSHIFWGVPGPTPNYDDVSLDARLWTFGTNLVPVFTNMLGNGWEATEVSQAGVGGMGYVTGSGMAPHAMVWAHSNYTAPIYYAAADVYSLYPGTIPTVESSVLKLSDHFFTTMEKGATHNIIWSPSVPAFIARSSIYRSAGILLVPRITRASGGPSGVVWGVGEDWRGDVNGNHQGDPIEDAATEFRQTSNSWEVAVLPNPWGFGATPLDIETVQGEVVRYGACRNGSGQWIPGFWLGPFGSGIFTPLRRDGDPIVEGGNGYNHFVESMASEGGVFVGRGSTSQLSGIYAGFFVGKLNLANPELSETHLLEPWLTSLGVNLFPNTNYDRITFINGIDYSERLDLLCLGFEMNGVPHLVLVNPNFAPVPRSC